MIRLNKEEIDKIIDYYKKGDTTLKIAKLYGFKTNKRIRQILINNGFNLKLRQGYNSRKCSVNESFFDVIDTPDKAYILGWIISDGYVNKNKLVFNLKDLDILETIKHILGSTHKITTTNVLDKRTNKIYTGYSLQICSKKIVSSLNKLGIHQAKSFTVDLPKIPNKLYQHLIRGIFDGDGYIGIGKTVVGELYPRFSIIVSEKLYISLNDVFKKINLTYKKPQIVSKKNGNTILKIMLYKKSDLEIFFKYIYPTNNVTKLNRKYEKVKKIYNW